MTKKITTRIQMDAPVNDVWAVLADFANYPSWNPFIVEISGQCTLGASLRIAVTLQPPKRQTFEATLLTLVPAQSLAWRGSWKGSTWLFCGLHQFDLRSLPNARTELTHSETFSGLLSAPIFHSIRHDTERGFGAMNAALERRLCASST
ncbi:SRPBCC domain-containing protein [Verminephrobacter aporrectodeae]|uniref:SRPBCC domain-containing protein n=1 Tax=Verminephrobacter aporrectodeae TaxID=1110389 RepID=UPI0002378514|nr:SRPBCC domain-containing protein [Verminephrobacter aporrectodeae]